MRQWTPEERRRQAEAIRRWKPWEKSTGPKTEKGKESAKMNAFKHGGYSRSRLACQRALLMNRLFVSYMADWARAFENERELMERVRVRKKVKERTINPDRTIKDSFKIKEMGTPPV